ncbi:MAG: DNA replication and repair protein RecF [Candidatus Nomurabacteria bacterium]|jgi:DNA replication and repair protein RecF|nr:DNA replication and repair protein RecF [Candidatus Nomurabacteria bacterium]
MNIIKSIKVDNFRIHQRFELVMNNQTMLITGGNGSGKTSLIEALYISLRGKSFRSSDKDILKKGGQFYRIETAFFSGEKVVAKYIDGKKEFEIGGKKYRRLPKKNRHPIVLFEPSNLNLIHNSPASRRDFFDNLISQIDEPYAEAVNKYKKSLKQRNNLLRKDLATPDNLFAWNVMLARYGTEIVLKRKFFIAEINELLTKTYQDIAKNNDKIRIAYENTEVDETEYLKVLEREFDKDLMLKSTSFGPHRDDFLFNFNNRLASNVASRGENRTIVLALKFIEAEVVMKYLNKQPIVLLDDIFSELDESRQKSLLKNFKTHQIIITSIKAPKSMKSDIVLN